MIKIVMIKRNAKRVFTLFGVLKNHNKSFSVLSNQNGFIVWLALIPVVLAGGALVLQQQLVISTKTAAIQKTTTTKNQMISIKNWLIANASDIDTDSYAELPAEAAGNKLPALCPNKSTDDNGKNFKYETWDLGVANGNAAYSMNHVAPPKPGMIGRLTAAGTDMQMGTADDIVMEIYNTDVMAFTNNSGFFEDVINHKVTQKNDIDQVAMGTQTPDGSAKLTIYNSISGVVASIGTALNTSMAWISLKAGGIEKGRFQWNVNDAGTANGTSMILNNLQGSIHINDNSNNGITVSGGSVGVGTTPTSKFHVFGGGQLIETTGVSSNTQTLTLTPQGIAQQNLGSYPGSWTSAIQIQADAGRYLWMSPLYSNSGTYSRIASSNGLDFYTNGQNATRALYLDPSGTAVFAAGIYPSNGNGGYLYADANGIRSSGNFLANGDLYSGALGWMTTFLNQPVRTDSNPTFSTVYTSNWFRSTGTSGWYNETYGGGIWMDDSSWVRTYGGKSFLAEGSLYAGGVIYPSGNAGGYLYGDGNGIWTSSNLLSSGDIYWGSQGVWMSTYFNQAVRTDSTPTFAGVRFADGTVQTTAAGAGAQYMNYIFTINGQPAVQMHGLGVVYNGKFSGILRKNASPPGWQTVALCICADGDGACAYNDTTSAAYAGYAGTVNIGLLPVTVLSSYI
jgi:hypothetical protein